MIIYTDTDGNLCVVTPFKGWTDEQILAKDIPDYVTDAEIISADKMPSDRVFRNAWKKGDKKVEFHIPKCKQICHKRRRAQRQKDMQQYDDIIARQIPGDDLQAAEAERLKLRTKYQAMQTAIDNSTTPEGMKTILNDGGVE